MMSRSQQLLEQFNSMDNAQQERLLNFARSLTQNPIIRGESGKDIAAATGYFDAESLDEMQAAIEADTNS